jgi:hypothetical protein
MMDLLNEFNPWGLASMAVAVVVATAFTRKALTFFFPTLRVVKSKDGLQTITRYSSRVGEFYHEIGLYLLPYLLAPLLALSKSTFLFGDIDRYGGKLVFALLVVTFSGLFVKIIKKKLPGLFGVELTEDTELPIPEE